MLAAHFQDRLILLLHKANNLVLLAIACRVHSTRQGQNGKLALYLRAEHSHQFHSSKHLPKIAIININILLPI